MHVPHDGNNFSGRGKTLTSYYLGLQCTTQTSAKCRLKLLVCCILKNIIFYPLKHMEAIRQAQGVAPVLVECRRRWANFKLALGLQLVFPAGKMKSVLQ